MTPFDIYKQCLEYIYTNLSIFCNLKIIKLSKFVSLGRNFVFRIFKVIDFLNKKLEIKYYNIDKVILKHPYWRDYILSENENSLAKLICFVNNCLSLFQWYNKSQARFCSNSFYHIYNPDENFGDFVLKIYSWHMKYGEDFIPLNKFIYQQNGDLVRNNVQTSIVLLKCIELQTFLNGATVLPDKNKCECRSFLNCVHRFYLNWESKFK